ncbi:MAG: hypothetical protein Fur0010_06010 [Bdellovibrio sp.]
MEMQTWSLEFIALIRQMLVGQNLTYQKVADRLGVSSKTLSRYLSGERIPKEKFVAQILEEVIFPHLSVNEIIRNHPEFREILAHRLYENKIKQNLDQAILHAIEINHELLLNLIHDKIKTIDDVFEYFGKVGLRDIERFERIGLLSIESKSIIHDLRINLVNSFIQQKLGTKLCGENYDPKRSGISNNLALNLVGKVDKAKAQIDIMKILRRTQREIQSVLLDSKYAGEDLVFVSIFTDQLEQDYLQ